MIRARKILGEILNLPPESIPTDASIESLPQWDSLNHMRLVLRLEEDIGRPINHEEMLAIVTVTAVADLLKK
jgi:acyl carrier protein